MNSIIKGLALEDVTRSIIMVAGVGGAGGNALNHMIDLGINDVTFMACNTDAQALEESRASIKIQLGSGLGAGNDPEKGSQAAKESIDDIINVLRTEGTRMLFITAGMGGGTGTGASPIIARAAQELDILTVAIVTTPFTNEGLLRTEQARKGIEELKQYTDSLLVLSNDSIEQLYPDLPYDEGFWRADDVLATAVKGIAEIITGHGTVNVDFADVNTVMRGSGRAFMGSARADGDNRAMDAVEASVSSLLLNHRDIRGAKNILLNISYGDRAVTQREAGSVRNYLQESTGWTANLIWGTAHKPSLGGELELTIVATGFPGNADDVVSLPDPAHAFNGAGTGVGNGSGYGASYGTGNNAGIGTGYGSGTGAGYGVNPGAGNGTGAGYGTAGASGYGANAGNAAGTGGTGGTSYGTGSTGGTTYGQGTRYTPDPDIVRPAPDRYDPKPAPPKGKTVTPPQNGTVQWKGIDRYADIEHTVGTPAWVRRKASLVDISSARPSSKTTLEKETPKEIETGSLFELPSKL